MTEHVRCVGMDRLSAYLVHPEPCKLLRRDAKIAVDLVGLGTVAQVARRADASADTEFDRILEGFARLISISDGPYRPASSRRVLLRHVEDIKARDDLTASADSD